MLEFAHALPGLRDRAAEHLAQDGLTRERVLACATRPLDRAFPHGHRGLRRAEPRPTAWPPSSAMSAGRRPDHLRLRLQERQAAPGLVLDLAVREVVAQLGRRGGGLDLLAFKRGWPGDVRLDDINDYIKEQTGGDFTAKDFRTWSATVLAAVAMASLSSARSKTARARAISRAVQEGRPPPGQHPAVCQALHRPSGLRPLPLRPDHRRRLEQLGEVEEFGEPAHQGAIEEAVLDLIEEQRLAPELDLIA